MHRSLSIQSLLFPLLLTTVPSEPAHGEHNFDSEETSRPPEAAPPDYGGFLSLLEAMKSIPPVYLRLVDKTHPLEPDYTPAQLVALTPGPGLRPSREGLQLDSRAAASLRTMAAAASRDGVTLIVSSAYRSFEYQAGLFRRFAASHGEKEASRFSARAGTSQHQLGTAADFGDITNAFAESEAGIWMAANAGRFGWSLSYPRGAEHITGYQWESWHWRWIGTPAVRMQDRFFEGSQQRLLEFWAAGPDTNGPDPNSPDSKVPPEYRNGTPGNRQP